jgi:hypothetical protein
MVRLFLFILILAAAILGIDQAVTSLVHPLAWWILGFFTVITLAGHWFIQKGLHQYKDAFMSIYLGVLGFRFLLSLLFIGIFIYKRIPEMLTFVINFFVLYLLFLGFEIYGVLGNLRRNSPGAS